ncbi:MAG: mucoidy inhibitor MuiA family protein [Pseudomonadota bacterium]
MSASFTPTKPLLIQLLAALSVTTMLVGPSGAAAFDVDGAVISATVYPSAASVTRQIGFDIPAGSLELVLELKDANLDPNSVRVTGAADEPITLLGVDTRNVQTLADTGDRRRELETLIEARETDLAALGQRRTVAEAQARLVNKLVDGIPDALAGEEGGTLPSAEQLLSALETIGTAQSRVVDARLELDAQEKTIRDELDALRLELSSLPSRRNVLQAVIRVDAATDAAGQLELSYLTQALGWQPRYDLALSTGGDAPNLSIRSQASIVQRTGEDWSDVTVALSTARPSGATEAGVLPSEQVSFLPERPAPVPTMKRSNDTQLQLEGMVQGGLAEPVVMAEQAAQVDFGGYRATFTLPGKTNLPSGDGARTVLISAVDMAVELETRATPLLTTEAFLHAMGEVPEGITVLPGEASLSRDGDLVGRTFLPRLSAGAPFDIGFGADDSVVVERLVADRSTGETGIITSSNRDRTAVTISVQNFGDQYRAIRLLDRVPFAEAEDIEIETSFPNGNAPSQVDVDGRRGVLSWSFDLAPGASRTVEARHTITWPGDKEIMRNANWPVRPGR